MVIIAASAVNAGPTLISYVLAAATFAENPVPVPIVTVVAVAAAVALILRVRAPSGTSAVDIAVIRPLPFTVMTGISMVDPNAPIFEFTAASVPAAVTLPDPSKLGEVYVISPVIDSILPVVHLVALVAVSALPVRAPVTSAYTLLTVKFLFKFQRSSALL